MGEELLRERMDALIPQMRRELSVEERCAIEEEEQEAALNDVVATEDASRCVACLDHQCAVVLLPCRHLATCHRCTVMIRRLGKCPMCREQISDIQNASQIREGER